MNEWIKTKADLKAIDDGCYFDIDAANRVAKFVEQTCVLSDGKRKGQHLKFLDWVWRDIVAPLHSWKRPDGLRRYRRGSCWTSKKQSKTTTLAALSIWQVLEEPAAQVYVVSDSIDSAGILYRIAADFVDASPLLRKRLKPRRNIKVIEDRKNNSFLKVLSGKDLSKSGQNASCVFWDELACIKEIQEEIWHQLYDSGMARQQPVWFSISTPQYQRRSLAFSQYKKAVAIQDGSSLDTEYLGVVHGVPSDVDYREPQNWWDHIPSFEIASKDYYRKRWEKVKETGSPRDIAQFRNHLLGQWTESECQWLDPTKYDACIKNIDLAELQGEECIIGLDGSLNNLAAYVLYFPHSKTCVPRFYIPRETARRDDDKLNTNYMALAAESHLTITDGDLFDWPRVKADILQELTRYNVVGVAYDPYKLDTRCAELTDIVGCPVVAVKPYRNEVAAPTKELERLVHSGELTVDDNPLMTSNARHAAVTADAHDRIALDREKSSGRYDGIAATVLAIAYELAGDTTEPTVYFG